MNFSDSEKLNDYILDEVNRIRKKAKVDSITNHNALFDAAEDHAEYMLRNDKLTHFQRWNKLKYNPKNRVDFYEGNFQLVGENVQQTHASFVAEELKRNRRVNDPYKALAIILVESWRKSPPHYANMIGSNYENTITAVAIGENGIIYACQLFGGTQYKDKYAESRKPVDYKPYRENKCKRTKADGWVTVDDEGNIFYIAESKKKTGFRWAWPWTEGIAADIVLMSQYKCDDPTNYNPLPGVRGIPLEPVYRKDFNKLGMWRKNMVKIPLGKVPDYIDEPYQVNLTIISRKRTCRTIEYNHLVAKINFPISLDFGLEKRSPYHLEISDSVITEKIFFKKSDTLIQQDTLSSVPVKLKNDYNLDSIHLTGFASIEGTFKNNKALFKKRTTVVKNALTNKSIPDNIISESSTENFDDFRSDLKNTKYNHLLELSDEKLKEKLFDPGLSDELEPILENHRYVQIKKFYSKKDTIKYTEDELIEEFYNDLQQNSYKKAEETQLKYLNLIAQNDNPVEDSLKKHLKNEKRFSNLKYNFLIYEYRSGDTLDLNRQELLKEELNKLLELDEKNRKIHTAIAFLSIKNVVRAGTIEDINELYRNIANNNLIDRSFKYKALLHLAMVHDLDMFYFKKKKQYLASDATQYIRKAKLDINETFSTAAFYYFFDYDELAFNMIKRIYATTDDPNHLYFFLFLVHHNSFDLAHKKKLRYFDAVAEKIPNEFCAFFEDGSLNFQLLNSDDHKIIYCEYCKGKVDY